VRVRGTTPEREVQAEKAFMVTAGSTLEVTLTLA